MRLPCTRCGGEQMMRLRASVDRSDGTRFERWVCVICGKTEKLELLRQRAVALVKKADEDPGHGKG